jgi:hypothetical protein
VTKEELKELVISSYSMYNQIILDIDKKNILMAWWEILQDLPYDGVKRALIDHACVSQFMPKPGDLRRRHLDQVSTEGDPPSSLVAWSLVTRTVEDSNAGVTPDTSELHPCIVQLISQLGNAVYGLRNSTDQVAFMKTYEQVVSAYQQQKYKIF